MSLADTVDSFEVNSHLLSDIVCLLTQTVASRERELPEAQHFSVHCIRRHRGLPCLFSSLALRQSPPESR